MATQQKPQNDLDKDLKDIQDNLSEYSDELDYNPPQQDTEPEPEKKTRKRRGRPPKRDKVFTEPVPDTPRQLMASDLITGALLLMMIDLAIPNIIAFANNKFSGKKIKARQLQLNESQKNELEPFANEAAKQLMIKGNPVSVFIVALVAIYGINFIALKNE